MRIALGLSYDGSAYRGWQNQFDDAIPTIQTCLDKALSSVANHPVTSYCAGRTDAGVHALGQTIHFDTEAIRDERAWVLGVNSHLPADIRVLWAKKMDLNFHVRFSAQARAYRYVIYNHFVHSALLRTQTSIYHQPLDEKRMQEASDYLIGEHDFSSFRAAECQAKTTIRKLEYLKITRQGRFIFIDVKANAFLHHMVRNIVGVLLAIGSGKKQPIWAQEVLRARNRIFASITASPQGLYFLRAFYPAEFALDMLETDYGCFGLL